MSDASILLERLESFGLDGLHISGGEVKMCCPFHSEDTPSFFAHPEKGCICFGCGKKLPSAEVLLEELSKMKGIPYEPLSDDAEYLFGIFSRTEGFPSPADPSVIEAYTFDAGYFERTWGISPEVSTRHNLRLDPYTGAECFPIFDRRERFWGFVERRMGPERSIYRYPRDLPKKEILLGEDVAGESVWVTEGIRDLCAVETLTGESAVALGSATASEEQVRLLMGYDKLTLALDNDSAGRRGTGRLLRLLTHSDVYIASYEGKDPADAADFSVHHRAFG